MKTLAVIGMLVVGTSFQAVSMGHPHNVFAARKQMRAKASTSTTKHKTASLACWQDMVQATKTVFAELVVVAFSQVSPAGAF